MAQEAANGSSTPQSSDGGTHEFQSSVVLSVTHMYNVALSLSDKPASQDETEAAAAAAVATSAAAVTSGDDATAAQNVATTAGANRVTSFVFFP